MPQPYDIQIADPLGAFYRGAELKRRNTRAPIEDAQQDAAFSRQQKQWGQQDEDREMEVVGNVAGMIANAPPAARAQYYASARPRLAAFAQKMGLPLPEVWSDDLLDEVQQIHQMFSNRRGQAASGVQSTYIDAQGNRVAIMRDGSTQVLGQNAPNVQIMEGAGGIYGVNKGSLQASPVTMGAAVPQAPPQGNSSALMATANQMIAAGVPPEYVEKWMAQQPGIQPVAEAGPQLQPKPDKPSALQERLAVAGQMGATPDEQKRMVLGGENGGQFDVKSEMALRKEYGDLIKEPLIVRNSYNKVAAAAKNPSAAGDLSMIFAYMKMLDPNSVVRETEFANAQNAAGVPDRVRNVWNRAMSGERLNPTQRADFVNQARTLAAQSQAQIDGYKKQYGDLAEQYGFSPERVAFDPFAPKGESPQSVPTVSTKAQYDALPSGSVYIEDGKKYRKP